MIFYAEAGWVTLIIFILWVVSGIVEAVRKHKREKAKLEKARQEAAQRDEAQRASTAQSQSYGYNTSGEAEKESSILVRTPSPSGKTEQVGSEEDYVIYDASRDEEVVYRSETKAPYEIVLQEEKQKPEGLGVSEESFSDFRPLATRSQRRAAATAELPAAQKPVMAARSSFAIELHRIDSKQLEQAFMFSEILSPSLSKRKERRLSLSSRWI